VGIKTFIELYVYFYFLSLFHSVSCPNILGSPVLCSTPPVIPGWRDCRGVGCAERFDGRGCGRISSFYVRWMVQPDAGGTLMGGRKRKRVGLKLCIFFYRGPVGTVNKKKYSKKERCRK